MRALARLVRSSPAATLGLAALVMVVVGSVAGGVRAKASLLETRERLYERLALADLELKLSPTTRGVLGGLVLPTGVATAEERAVTLGRFSGGRAKSLPTVVRVLPAAGPPRINVLEIEPGGHYPGPDEAAVVVDRSLRDVHGVALGDTVTLSVGKDTLTLPVVGVSLSPEHLFAPSHPAYGLIVRGTAGALGVSEAAVKGREHAEKVTSLLFRFEPGGSDAGQVERALLERGVGRHVRESVPQDREMGRLFTDFLLRTFDLYLPTIIGGFAVVGLLLLVLLVARGVDRRRRELGLRLALGERPVYVACAYAALPLAGTALGALLGALLHGAVAMKTAGTWAANMGFPPLVDAGPQWGAVLAASAACLATAFLAGGLPALWLSRRRPARLLHETALGTRRAPGPVARIGARLTTALRLPPPLALALAGVLRRRRETIGAIVGVALSTTLVLALLAVNVSHRVAAREGLRASTLDATVHFRGPVNESTVRQTASALSGKAEPFVARSVRLAVRGRLETRRLLGVLTNGWLTSQRLAAGRMPASTDAPEAVVDLWVAHRDGLEIGDPLLLFPDPDAPEGVEVRLVGILDGMSIGRVVVPIGIAHRLYGVGGALRVPEDGNDLFLRPFEDGRRLVATGVFVRSSLGPARLEQRIAELDDVEIGYTAARAMGQADSAFTGSLGVLRLALVTAVFLALLILGVLAFEEARDRGPEVALLKALGWRRRSLALVTVGEVLARGIPALLLAGFLAWPVAQAFLDRVEAVNGYRVALHLEPWLVASVLVPGLLLLPLAALPALRTGHRAPPARVLRSLLPQ
jgi:hypothetical protein